MAEGKQLPVLQPGKNAGQTPVFQRVGIVGLGLIGGSIALAARDIWPAGLVIGVDRKDVLERAMVRHAIDVAADDPVVLAEADLVILAAPIQQNLELLRELPDHVAGSAVVTDTGSTKREIVEAARSLPERLTFIGGHPLGGAARGGIDHARPDLFTGRPWLFTPGSDPRTVPGSDPGRADGRAQVLILLLDRAKAGYSRAFLAGFSRAWCLVRPAPGSTSAGWLAAR